MEDRVCPETRKLATKLLASVDSSYRIEWGSGVGKGRFSEFTWDGTGILRMSDCDDLLAIHDIAHVMLSAPSRRKLPEFGLGPDPSNPSNAKRVVSAKNAQREEDQVCDLHWCIVAYLHGEVGADLVLCHLGMNNIPTLDVIEEFGKRYPLPEDFVSVVSEVAEAVVP